MNDFLHDEIEAAALLDRHPVSGDRRTARATSHWVGVPDGEIRVFHFAAQGVQRGMPVVFVPGWGGVLKGFEDALRSVDPSIDLYYVETREKRSSRVGRGAVFSMRRIAADVGAAAEAMGLPDRGFVLVGTSFGGAVVLQTVADRAARPAVAVLFDPMPRLWVPRWIMSSVVPLTPAWLLATLRPALKRLVLAGMREPTQRNRAARFIDDAVLWKWRAASLRLREWDLFDVGSRVTSDIDVVNGCTDRFHDGSIYPRIARSIPGARLLRIPVSEAHREHLMGVVISEYADSRRTSGSGRSKPQTLDRFVQALEERRS